MILNPIMILTKGKKINKNSPQRFACSPVRTGQLELTHNFILVANIMLLLLFPQFTLPHKRFTTTMFDGQDSEQSITNNKITYKKEQNKKYLLIRKLPMFTETILATVYLHVTKGYCSHSDQCVQPVLR